jgi:hypothetical protein
MEGFFELPLIEILGGYDHLRLVAGGREIMVSSDSIIYIDNHKVSIERRVVSGWMGYSLVILHSYGGEYRVMVHNRTIMRIAISHYLGFDPFPFDVLG